MEVPDEHERLRTLFQRSPVGLLFTALDGSIISVNAAACALLGRAEADLVGFSAPQVVHPDDRDDARRHLRDLLAGDLDELRLERRYVRPDGSMVWADMFTQAVRAADGTLVYVQSFLVDVTKRIFAEQAQGQLSAIVESSRDAIIGATLEGIITTWNPAAERLYGYSAEEMLGNTGTVLVPDEPAGERERVASDILAGRTVEDYQAIRRRKDGTSVRVSMNAWPVLNATGNTAGIATTVRDLSEYERMQARFRGLLEASPDAMISIDGAGIITMANAPTERLFGYPRGQVVGLSAATLFPEHAAAVESGLRPAIVDQLAAGADPVTASMTGRRADGSEFPAELSVSASDSDEGVVTWTAIRDGTERLQAAIVASSSDAIIARNLDGEITSWNAGAVRMYGYGADEAVGSEMTVMIPPGRADELPELTDRIHRGEPVEHYETERVRRDGTTIFVSVSMSPIHDAPGRIVGTSAVARDITDRKRIEAERDALSERLRRSERLESLGQLAGGVAHDFNNLLGAILNYAKFAADQTTENPDLNADIQQIQAAAERGARLTRQLLIVGRREPIHLETLELNVIVADIRDLLARSIGGHIELNVHPEAALPRVRADRGQIDQVLLNLAVNARDAMPSGGTLTIATRLTELDDGYVRLHANATPGRHVELSVSDTGSGMSREVTEHIFEPFFTTKPRGQGTGLGLATVYAIVTEAGGSVSVYSEEGIGTTFRVLFPAVDQPATPAPAVPAADPGGHGETILLVEDEPALLKSTARILEGNGYIVLAAATGTDALAIAAEHDVQLLLTDSVMPNMSGSELAENILTLRPGLPILFMSGYSERMVGRQRIVSEDMAFVGKPFTVQALLQRIRTTMYGAPGDPAG
jgi:PAS domain S-box-containing protein